MVGSEVGPKVWIKNSLDRNSLDQKEYDARQQHGGRRGRAPAGGCRARRKGRAGAESPEAAPRRAVPLARHGRRDVRGPRRRAARRPKMPRGHVRMRARPSVLLQRGARGGRWRDVVPPVSRVLCCGGGPRRRAPPPGTVRWRGGDRKEGQQLDRPRGRELSRQLDRGHARERAAPVLRRQSRWNETSQLDNQEINDSNAELGPRTCRKQGASEIAAAEKGCATQTNPVRG